MDGAGEDIGSLDEGDAGGGPVAVVKLGLHVVDGDGGGQWRGIGAEGGEATGKARFRILVEVVEGVGINEAVLVLLDGVAGGVVGVGELVAGPRGAVGKRGGGIGELADGVVAIGVNLAVLADDLGALVGVVKGEGEGGEDAGIGTVDEVRQAEESVEGAFGGGAVGEGEVGPEGSGGGVGVGVGSFGPDDGGEASEGVVGIFDVVEGRSDGGELVRGGVVVVEGVVGKGAVFRDEIAEDVVGVGRGADGVAHGGLAVQGVVGERDGGGVGIEDVGEVAVGVVGVGGG